MTPRGYDLRPAMLANLYRAMVNFNLNVSASNREAQRELAPRRL
jgi:hypothetical protein